MHDKNGKAEGDWIYFGSTDVSVATESPVIHRIKAIFFSARIPL